jgi:hypothetical protein
LKRTRLANFDARRSFKAAALLYPSRARGFKRVPPDDGVEKLLRILRDVALTTLRTPLKVF